MLTRRLTFAPLALAIVVGAAVLLTSIVSASAPATASAAASSTYTIKWRKAVRKLGGKTGGFTAVSCAAVNMCVAVDASGHVVWSTKPRTNSAKNWRMARVDGHHGGFTGISCPIKRFCAAVDATGHVVWSTNPTGGRKAWSSPVRIDPVKSPGGGYVGLAGIACPSKTICVAVDNASNGEVLVSRNPTGGRSTWHRATITSGQQLTSVACPSTTLCVAGGNETYYATRLYGNRQDWTAAAATPGSGVISAIGCAKNTSVCVGVGYNNTSPGFAFASSSAAGSGWGFQPVESYPPAPGQGLINGVGCPNSNFCVALDTADNAYTTNSPAAGNWVGPTAVRPNSATITAELACVQKLCVAVDNRGVITSGAVRGS